MKRPNADAVILAAPDPQFRLSAEQRAVVQSKMDVDVLERVMARIRPEFRDHLLADLRHFHEQTVAGKVALGTPEISVSDPELVGLLRQLLRSSVLRAGS